MLLNAESNILIFGSRVGCVQKVDFKIRLFGLPHALLPALLVEDKVGLSRYSVVVFPPL